jgi:hypothetical protein
VTRYQIDWTPEHLQQATDAAVEPAADADASMAPHLPPAAAATPPAALGQHAVDRLMAGDDQMMEMDLTGGAAPAAQPMLAPGMQPVPFAMCS